MMGITNGYHWKCAKMKEMVHNLVEVANRWELEVVHYCSETLRTVVLLDQFVLGSAGFKQLQYSCLYDL